MSEQTPEGCPKCGAEWRSVELVGNARSGGGYLCHCHVCGHKWDDPNASHGAREDARRADKAATTRPIEPVCGAEIVTREYEGAAAEVVMCLRRSGPCPWRKADGTVAGLGGSGAACAIKEASDE